MWVTWWFTVTLTADGDGSVCVKQDVTQTATQVNSQPVSQMHKQVSTLG